MDEGAVSSRHRRGPRRRRRIWLAALAVLALVLVGAEPALAAAGGGSAGFGGGGGGLGGGGGGGRGFFIYILFQLLFRVAVLGHGLGLLIIFGVILLGLLYTRGVPAAAQSWSAWRNGGRAGRRRLAQRERRVELASAEAAEENPMFGAERVREEAAALFTEIQAAWDAGDRVRLRALVAPSLLAEWERRLDDLQRRGWRNRVMPLGEPTVQYVGLSHGGSGQDHVVVRIDARLRDYVQDRHGRHLRRVGRMSETVRTREFWTLGPRGQRWILLSIEQGAEGAHALQEHIVAAPWSDAESLRDQALVEGAVADALPDGVALAEVADLHYRGGARAAALDLSLVDGRFAPQVLEVAARHAVDAWAQAVDGDDHALLALARPAAARSLLHPGEAGADTRLVVRGPRVREIRIEALDAAAQPPTMTIEVDLVGLRYLQDRSTTAVLSGNPSRETAFTERWTLALDGDTGNPWRIAAAGEPAPRAD
jgi:predicted lipid-binding transport protein (Tim44 family)